MTKNFKLTKSKRWDKMLKKVWEIKIKIMIIKMIKIMIIVILKQIRKGITSPVSFTLEIH